MKYDYYIHSNIEYGGPSLKWKDGKNIDSFGNQLWYKNGLLHREAGPAVIHSANKSKHWYQNGERHRKDGPAVIWLNGFYIWWVNGKCHREDGPAVICSNGYKEWWIHDQKVFINVIIKFLLQSNREII
jgi:hypothetical protein